MRNEPMNTIEAAIDDAMNALPNGDDRQLTNWVIANRYPSFPREVREALADEGLKEQIREAARKSGVTLQE